MNRRESLRTLLLAAGLPLGAARAAARVAAAGDPPEPFDPSIAARLAEARSEVAAGTCWVTPEETEGPFYFDPALIRQDVREGRPGVPLTLVMSVVDPRCAPVPGALVDLWHCDRDGLYSGYEQPAGETSGRTFLRGTQVTNAGGAVIFSTIYPGWYRGRATHVHFKVRSGERTYKTSQFCFPEDVSAKVHASKLYAKRGPNPLSNADDFVFGEARPKRLTLDLSGDVARGFVGRFTVGLAASPAGGRSS